MSRVTWLPVWLQQTCSCLVLRPTHFDVPSWHTHLPLNARTTCHFPGSDAPWFNPLPEPLPPSLVHGYTVGCTHGIHTRIYLNIYPSPPICCTLLTYVTYLYPFDCTPVHPFIPPRLPSTPLPYIVPFATLPSHGHALCIYPHYTFWDLIRYCWLFNIVTYHLQSPHIVQFVVVLALPVARAGRVYLPLPRIVQFAVVAFTFNMLPQFTVPPPAPTDSHYPHVTTAALTGLMPLPVR